MTPVKNSICGVKTMKHLLVIACGGSLGAVARYIASKNIQSITNQFFPFGTLFVNCSGSFCIGFLFYAFDSLLVSRDIRSFLTIGFLGAFTTFSTYSLETVNLFRDREIKLALVNILLNNIISISMVIAGMIASKIFLKILQ